MKISIVTMLIALFPLVGHAKVKKNPNQSILSRVVDAKYADFNDDAEPDTAVLVDNGDAAVDVYIFTGKTENGDFTRNLAVSLKGEIFHGLLWGTHAKLDIRKNGSLVIQSGNENGRDRWQQLLTVAYRDGEFKIVGITYDYYDSIQQRDPGECDLNLLTGKGMVNGKWVNVAVKPIPLAEWSDAKLPKECRFAQ